MVDHDGDAVRSLHGLEADHDRLYLHDVLGLNDTETDDAEARLDQSLRKEALELGIDVDALSTDPSSAESTKRLSLHTVTSDTSRRSESVHSQSTGLTSIFSELSFDRQRRSGVYARSPGTAVSGVHGITLGRRLPAGIVSSSSSPITTPSTSFSSLSVASSSSSPKKTSRRIKALNVLKLVRPESESRRNKPCPHCRRDDRSKQGANLSRLECGHCWCPDGLVQEFQRTPVPDARIAPTCCGMRIPRSFLEEAVSQREQSVGLDTFPPQHEAKYSSALELNQHHSQHHHPLPPAISLTGTPSRSNDSSSSNPPSTSSIPHRRNDYSWAGNNKAFQELTGAHNALISRFETWQTSSQTSLTKHTTWLSTNQRQAHDAAVEALSDQHSSAILEMEDKQVRAEAELREDQAQEKRDNATALKHMEAYCAGTYSTSGQAHFRPVTEQARAQLDETRRICNTMDSRHESAINVLRGEQNRRLQAKLRRQAKELMELKRGLAKEKTGLDRLCERFLCDSQKRVEERKRRMGERWDLEVAILASKAGRGVVEA